MRRCQGEIKEMIEVLTGIYLLINTILPSQILSRICLIAVKKFKLKKIQMICLISLISMANKDRKNSELGKIQSSRMPKSTLKVAKHQQRRECT